MLRLAAVPADAAGGFTPAESGNGLCFETALPIKFERKTKLSAQI
jgi:hypothetical protein